MSLNGSMGRRMAVLERPKPGSDAPGCDHTVQFYGDDAFLLDELSRFVGSALGAGEAAVVIATEAHRDRLTDRLRARGIDTTPAAEGRYVALDAPETLATITPGGRLDLARAADILRGVIVRASAAATGGQPRLAVFGELGALLCAAGQHEAAIRLEALWSDLARTHGFRLLCAYPMCVFARAEDGRAIAKVCAAHGRVIPAEDYASLTDEEGRLRAIALLQQKARALETEIDARTRAQTALQRREAELADFLENAVEGVQQVGADQVIRWANRALLNLLGYAADEYVGQPLGAFHADRIAFDRFWQKLLRREDLYDYPARLRCKDGSVRDVLICANALWAGGRLAHTRCFIRDVTEQRRMEQALRERNRELSAAIVAREDFLAIAAHELKTPITSLRAFAQLLLRDLDRGRAIAPDRLALALDAIERQTGKLSHLVTRLLDTTEIEAGKLRIAPEPTDLAALVRSAMNRYRGDRDHRFVFAGPERLEAVVDPECLEQVITNLLDNAVKFSPDGGTVTVELGPDAGGDIRLAVTDQGVGVPPDQREAIFDRFRQAHDWGPPSGLGLGLYVTREFVGLHGGSVRIEEPEQPGSRFVVTLPPARPDTRSEPRA